MPFKYKDTCYSNVTEIGEQLLSEPALAHSTGVSAVVTASPAIYQNQLNVIYNYKPFSTAAITSHQIVRSFPTCSQLGLTTTNTNMSVADAVELSWLVIGVFVSAYMIKILRRSL